MSIYSQNVSILTAIEHNIMSLSITDSYSNNRGQFGIEKTIVQRPKETRCF